jgi:hypothetical protein
MKPDSSLTWRTTGDYAAFETGQWEFKSRLYYSAACQLRTNYASQVQSSPFEAVACLVVAQFNMALAVELVCKALYLKTASNPGKEVYTHKVADLLPKGLLSQEQAELLSFAVEIVEWAGRYPTPRWDKETHKDRYDIPEKNGPNSFDANDIPNRASIGLIDVLETLYCHVHEAWAA